MHLSRPAAAVVVTLACAAGLALSGCSNAATGSTDPSSFVNVSGSAVAVADDVAALCAQIVEQKLSPDAAAASAEGSGYTTRIGSVENTISAKRSSGRRAVNSPSRARATLPFDSRSRSDGSLE